VKSPGRGRAAGLPVVRERPWPEPAPMLRRWAS